MLMLCQMAVMCTRSHCVSRWLLTVLLSPFFVLFKQMTAYEVRISDWSTDVCSSDLFGCRQHLPTKLQIARQARSKPMIAPGNATRARHREPRMSIRSEERRVGHECVSACRYRRSPYH